MNKIKAFTLVELMVTVVVVGVVAAIAVPNMSAMVDSNRLTSNINELIVDLNLARSEAVKRGSNISLCKSIDGASCTTTGGYSSGWLVFLDDNGDGLLSGSVDEKIFSKESLTPGYSLTSSTGFSNHITFTSTGRSDAVGSFLLCKGSDISKAKAIYVNIAGRVRLAKDENGNGKPETPSGTDWTSCT